MSGRNSPMLARNCPFWHVLGAQGELFRAHTHARPSMAKYFAHSTQRHGEIETDDTTARPQQGTAETGITSASENCTKYSHFSPAKATAVSIPHRRKRAKATAVSDHRAASPAAPTRGTRGRAWLRHPWAVAGPCRTTSRRAEPHVNTPGPTGVEGAGGTGGAWLQCPWAVAGPCRTTSRRAEPRARGADGSRAGRRPRAHQAARPHRTGRPAPGTPAGPRSDARQQHKHHHAAPHANGRGAVG